MAVLISQQFRILTSKYGYVTMKMHTKNWFIKTIYSVMMFGFRINLNTQYDNPQLIPVIRRVGPYTDNDAQYWYQYLVTGTYRWDWSPHLTILLHAGQSGFETQKKHTTSNGSWCMGIKGEMSDTVCVTFTWYMYIYELFIAFVCFVVCSLL